jgi:phosphomannomutase
MTASSNENGDGIANVDRIIKRDDIRGKYPGEVNEVVAYFLGRAIARVIFHVTRPAIAVGFDARLSSPALAQAVMRGLAEEGADVRELGPCSTEIVYFAAGSHAADGGVMVTASHNPKDENGFKIVKQGAVPIDSGELKRLGEEIKKQLQARVERGAQKPPDLLRHAQDDRAVSERPVQPVPGAVS